MQSIYFEVCNNQAHLKTAKKSSNRKPLHSHDIKIPDRQSWFPCELCVMDAHSFIQKSSCGRQLVPVTKKG